MWEREDRVLVFSGLIDSSGTKTDVQIGTIVEVGEYELLIKFSTRSWDGPKRISKERCMPILRNFHIPKPSTHPEVGDLILVTNSTYRSDQEKKIVGTVQSIIYSITEPAVEIMTDGEMKKIPLSSCFILQRPPKKTEEFEQECYIINVTKNQKDSDEKIEATKTLPSRRPPSEI